MSYIINNWLLSNVIKHARYFSIFFSFMPSPEWFCQKGKRTKREMNEGMINISEKKRTEKTKREAKSGKNVFKRMVHRSLQRQHVSEELTETQKKIKFRRFRISRKIQIYG